jgi:hypothetical protein
VSKRNQHKRRGLLRFEHRSEPLLSAAAFSARVLKHVLWAAAVVFVGVTVGVLGYHWIARLPWIDALLNASMILGGMGPVDTLSSTAAKLFASGYALFSGVLFIAIMGLVLAPVLHRVLHRLHLEDSGR